MKIIFFITLILFFFIKEVYSKSTIQELGDFTQLIVPAYALGLSINEELSTGNYEATKQFLTSITLSQITVHTLKHVVKEERPDKTDKKSFPSGHTAAAFSGATFIHKRYGINKAILPYMLAVFTGYSRIYAKRHYWHDVVAGAAISSLFTWLFVDKYNTSLAFTNKSIQVGFNINF